MAALRSIIAGGRKSTRLETRCPGADVNPYLLTAAVLAGIHLGLELRLDPGPPLAGNAYRDHTPTIPLHWPEALTAFERSAFARDYFGEPFTRLYASVRRGEMLEFSSHVSALEYAWYLTTM